MNPRSLHAISLSVTLATTIIAGGCAQQQSITVASAAVESPKSGAANMMAQGRYAEAAAAYAQIGATPGELESTEFRLRAGLIYADLGDMPRALPLISPATSGAATVRQSLADGLTLIHEGAYDKASFVISSLDASGLEGFEKGLFLRTLGKIQRQAGDQAAILNLFNAELFPMPANRRTELTHLVWEALRINSDSELREKLDASNPNLAGWLALQQEFRASSDPSALATTLADWRLQYSSHPANELLIDEIVELAEEQSAPLQRVALLLPLEGELAGYAAAVRDGFTSMRFATGDLSLNLRIYAATGASAAEVYGRAVTDGAQLVIGPLDKSGIEGIMKLTERSVPILALNYIAGALPAGSNAISPTFTQFGLAPEDEGEDLAHRAWQDGHRRMACILPDSELGARIGLAFAGTWANLGGVLINESRYVNSVSAYKAAIKETFSLAQSEARAAVLRRLLQRPIVFVSKPRPDLDAVMLVADPITSRQMMPQFRYLGVDHLPIYATSQIFDGAINAAADQDLDSIIFNAMPWSLNAQDRDMRHTLDRHWARSSAAHRRLFAFGMDAYRIVKALPQMSRDPDYALAGATGVLRRDPTGRIKRSLAWAVFRDGMPRRAQAQ